MISRNVDSQVYWRGAVRVCVYLTCVVFLVVVFLNLLSSWSIQLTSNWLGLDHWSIAALKKERYAVLALALGDIRNAQSCVENEYDCLQTEQDAFIEFAEEIQQLTVATRSNRSDPSFILDTKANEDQLQKIRNYYRETIMAVPHYKKDYGESLRENMAREFSQEIATPVVEGQHFSTPLQHLLVKQANISAKKRSDFLKIICEERDSLSTVYHRLRETYTFLEKGMKEPLDQLSFSELVTCEEKLRTEINSCEELLMIRQQEIHQKSQGVSRTKHELYRYLYDPLAVTFPVLNTTLDTIQCLQNQRKELFEILITNKSG